MTKAAYKNRCTYLINHFYEKTTAAKNDKMNSGKQAKKLAAERHQFYALRILKIFIKNGTDRRFFKQTLKFISILN